MAIMTVQTGLIQEAKPDLVVQSCAIHAAAGESLEALDFAATVDAAGLATDTPERVTLVDVNSPL